MRIPIASFPILALVVAPLGAQVTIRPETVEPAAWERFALQVVNQQPIGIVRVRLEVPEAVAILGTQAPPGWRFTVSAATDSTPQTIEWWGDSLAAGTYEEFAFLGRIMGDARRRSLVFPVTIGRVDGTERRWGAGGEGRAPRVLIRGATFMTTWGAAALGGAALGVSALALAFAAFRGKP